MVDTSGPLFEPRFRYIIEFNKQHMGFHHFGDSVLFVPIFVYTL